MKKLITLLIASAGAASAFGNWQILDDFQSLKDGDVFTDATDFGWNSASASQTDMYFALADPEDSTNIGLFVESGDYGNSSGNVWMIKALGDGGIEPGETGTLYMRCLWSGLNNNWHWGTADRALVIDPETGNQTQPYGWGEYNALFRSGAAQILEHRDGGGFVATNPPQGVTVGSWYHFWIVVENTWDETTSPPTSTGVFSLYVQGAGFGDGQTPTLVPVGTDPAKDKAFLRRAPADEEGNPQAIVWSMFATNSGPSSSPNTGDPFILDDFAFWKNGPRLVVPSEDAGVRTWAGLPVSDVGDVDTDTWMGWLNINMEPYVWSYSLNQYIYLEESAVGEGGGWTYVFNY
jgi:hypothetical protein